MAVVGLNRQSIYIDVGSNGSLSDAGVFRNCSLFEALENGLLPNNGVIVGDDAFPLKTYLMKPYPVVNLAYDEKIYNYRLSRGYESIPSIRELIACNVTTVEKTVRAAFALHIWLTNNGMGT
jgi:hypothetical protein